MIDAVWKVSSFQAEACVESVDVPVFACQAAIQEVTRVVLETWLRGVHSHLSTTEWFVDFAGKLASGALRVDNVT